MVRERVAASAENSVVTWATAYEQAASQAVYCQTFPTLLSVPMEKVSTQTSSPGYWATT
jgi:hypothetical protein